MEDNQKQEEFHVHYQAGDDLNELEGEVKEFYEYHGVQLISINFPASKSLIEKLYYKLKNQVFDSSNNFQIIDNQEDELYQLKCVKDLKKNEDVFLIDHAISFKYEQLREILEKNEDILTRVYNMVKYWGPQKLKLPAFPKELVQFQSYEEFDELDLKNPLLELKDLNQDLISISLYDNQIEDLEVVREFLKKMVNLKVIWLNNNPVCQNEGFWQLINEDFPKLEIVNSVFTQNVSEWGIKFVSFARDLSKVDSVQEKDVLYLNLEDRDIFKLKNLEIFKSFSGCKKLNLKGHSLETFEETNNFLALLKNFQNLEEILVDEQVSEIILELNKTKQFENICPKLCYLNGFDLRNWLPVHANEKKIKFVLDHVWKVASSYRLASENQYDEQSVWYVMDELGISVQNSDSVSQETNVQVSPFMFATNNKLDEQVISYSLLWPIQDLKEETYCYRDFLKGFDENQQRSHRLICWFDLPNDMYFNQIKENRKKLEEIKNVNKEKIENIQQQKQSETTKYQKVLTKFLNQEKILVCTDSEILTQNLKIENVSFTDQQKDADIIFITQAQQEFHSDLQENQVFNQFPNEICIINKKNLANTIYNCYGKSNLIQDTYDLEHQLPVFIGDYLERENYYQNNIWILKPPNMARSMDMVITDNLSNIIRQMETGPRLIQKYMENPLTIDGKKIDLRYIVILKSIEPLEVYVYEVFWIRFSNNNFTNDYRTREIYETHFTVMNYGKSLKQVHFSEFIQQFDQQYGEKIQWKEVNQKIYNLVRELFVAVKISHPEVHDPRCFSIYGLDVMIEKDSFEPKILEMTFSPDCTRACKYHPSFYEDIFNGIIFGKEPALCKMKRVI